MEELDTQQETTSSNNKTEKHDDTVVNKVDEKCDEPPKTKKTPLKQQATNRVHAMLRCTTNKHLYKICQRELLRIEIKYQNSHTLYKRLLALSLSVDFKLYACGYHEGCSGIKTMVAARILPYVYNKLSMYCTLPNPIFRKEDYVTPALGGIAGPLNSMEFWLCVNGCICRRTCIEATDYERLYVDKNNCNQKVSFDDINVYYDDHGHQDRMEYTTTVNHDNFLMARIQRILESVHTLDKRITEVCKQIALYKEAFYVLPVAKPPEFFNNRKCISARINVLHDGLDKIFLDVKSCLRRLTDDCLPTEMKHEITSLKSDWSVVPCPPPMHIFRLKVIHEECVEECASLF